jgi:hypothetical protein
MWMNWHDEGRPPGSGSFGTAAVVASLHLDEERHLDFLDPIHTA